MKYYGIIKSTYDCVPLLYYEWTQRTGEIRTCHGYQDQSYLCKDVLIRFLLDMKEGNL